MSNPTMEEIEAFKYFYVTNGVVFFDKTHGWCEQVSRGSSCTLGSGVKIDPEYEDMIAISLDDGDTVDVLLSQIEDVVECSCEFSYVLGAPAVKTSDGEYIAHGETHGIAVLNAMKELYARNGYIASREFI